MLLLYGNVGLETFGVEFKGDFDTSGLIFNKIQNYKVLFTLLEQQ